MRGLARLGALILALSGLGGSLWGAIAIPRDFAFGWLVAEAAFASWPLGAIALIFIHALTGGRWGMVIGRELRAGALLMPLVLLGAIPLILLGHHLYPWLDPHLTIGNRFYLNARFATIRLVLYAAVWMGLWAVILGIGETRPDWLRLAAPPGLMLLALTVTFAAIDAAESLDPHFNSAVYGMIVLAGMVLFALALALLQRIASPIPILPEMRLDFGRLLLGMTILWGYLEFVQLLIVWESNLPQEAAWYLKRSAHGWDIVAGLLAAVHFGLPFFLLLSRKPKRRLGIIAATAGLSATMEILRWAWLVLPETPSSLMVIGSSAASIAGLAALGSLGFASVYRRLGDITYEVPAKAGIQHG